MGAATDISTVVCIDSTSNVNPSMGAGVTVDVGMGVKASLPPGVGAYLGLCMTLRATAHMCTVDCIGIKVGANGTVEQTVDAAVSLFVSIGVSDVVVVVVHFLCRSCCHKEYGYK